MIHTATRIEGVTVFRRGARIVRAGEIARANGSWAPVRITGLPLALEDGSVRVRVERAEGDRDGTAALPVASDARVILEVPEPDPSLAPPDDETLRQARIEAGELEAKLAVVRKQIARLESVANAARPPGAEGEPPPPTPFEARLAWIELRAREQERLGEEARALERQLRQAQERVADLDEKWRRASTARQPRQDELRKAVLIRLDAPTDGSATRARIAIEYLVPGARWAPAYSLRIARDGAEATLGLRAVVAQQSGEDWKDVRLVLSTADPQRWTELPELASLRIGRAQKPPKRGWRPPPADTATLYADYDRELPPLPPPRSAPPAPAARSHAAPPPSAAPMQAAAPIHDLLSLEEQVDDHDERVVATRAGVLKPAAARLMRQALGGAPPAPGAPPPAELQQSAYAPPRAKAPGRAPAEAGTLEEESLSLDYGDMRMPGPEHPSRGRLAIWTRTQLYTEMLVSMRVVLGFAAETVIAGAESAARAVGSRDLPPRHRDPSGRDGFDWSYPADAPVGVPSDGAFHAIALGQHATRPEIQYVVVPRETPEVFRMARLQSPLDSPMLAGPCDVYVGDEYLVTADLPSAGPRGKIDLGLGVEQAIKVARNATFDEESGGLIVTTLALRHEVRIEAVSHLPRRIDLEVRERIPTTRENEDEVEVRLGTVDPPWKPYEQKEPWLRGGFAWLIALEPGKPRQLRAQYEVRINPKNELVGGNRREA